jgi:hypothetical protein
LQIDCEHECGVFGSSEFEYIHWISSAAARGIISQRKSI